MIFNTYISIKNPFLIQDFIESSILQDKERQYEVIQTYIMFSLIQIILEPSINYLTRYFKANL